MEDIRRGDDAWVCPFCGQVAPLVTHWEFSCYSRTCRCGAIALTAEFDRIESVAYDAICIFLPQIREEATGYARNAGWLFEHLRQAGVDSRPGGTVCPDEGNRNTNFESMWFRRSGALRAIRHVECPSDFRWVTQLDGGRYRFCQHLAGNVCVAVDCDGTEVIIKRATGGPDGLPTYDDPKNEIEIHTRLKHPRVAEFVAAYPESVLVTRRIQGESMARRYFLSPCGAREATKMLIAVTEAVAYLHENGIIHRDITPQNVVCHHDEATLVDLGSAVEIGSPEHERRFWAKTVLRADDSYPAFFWAGPPEEVFTAQSDIFYLGCLGRFMLTGIPLADRSSANPGTQIPNTVNPALKNILTRAMSKDPETRYATAGEMLHELNTCLTQLRQSTLPAPQRRNSLPEESAAGLDDTGTKTHATIAEIGRFKIGPMIGRGGLADVYLGEDSATQEKVAIKIARDNSERSGAKRLFHWAQFGDSCIQDSLSHDQANEVLLREGDILTQISDPRFVKVKDKGFFKGRYYLVLEHVAGETLDSKMRIGSEVSLSWFLDLCDALMAAEKYGLLYHGDLKPQNIIIIPSSIKILDPSSQATINGHPMRVRTAAYAPFPYADCVGGWRLDVIAIGCMLYEATTGFMPIAGTKMANSMDTEKIFLPACWLNPGIPQTVNQVISQALDATESYSDFTSFRADLARIFTQGVTTWQKPSCEKVDAIMRVLAAPAIADRDLRTTIEFIVGYTPPQQTTLVTQ